MWRRNAAGIAWCALIGDHDRLSERRKDCHSYTNRYNVGRPTLELHPRSQPCAAAIVFPGASK